MANERGGRVPRPVGELVALLRGETCVLGVSPKMYNGEQKKSAEGVPMWSVDIAYRPKGGGRPQTLRATYASAQRPVFSGEWVARDCAIPARLYDFEGDGGRVRGWSYTIDERTAATWRAKQ